MNRVCEVYEQANVGSPVSIMSNLHSRLYNLLIIFMHLINRVRSMFGICKEKLRLFVNYYLNDKDDHMKSIMISGI